jgi:hypothetical protein
MQFEEILNHMLNQLGLAKVRSERQIKQDFVWLMHFEET